MTFIEEASKEFNMEPPLCEHTLRKAIERLREGGCRGWQIAALEELLPKPSPMKDLQAMGQQFDTAAELREKVIRECMEALPKPSLLSGEDEPVGVAAHAARLAAYTNAQLTLEALLPKKDRAKELVEALADNWEHSEAFKQVDHEKPGGEARSLLRWLISNNLINEKGAL